MSGKRLLKKLYYAFLLARRGGLGVLVRLFFSRIHSTVTYVWLAKDLKDPINLPQVSYSLRPASPEGFRKISDGLGGERGQDAFEIFRRISFFERGFDACYFALTDSGQVCHMAWLLSASHNDLIQSQYPSGMGRLSEGEVLLENIFTFPSYRSKGIMNSVTLNLADSARRQGFRRILAYVDTENKTSLRGFLRAGFYYFDGEKEKRRFFRIWRFGQDGNSI